MNDDQKTVTEDTNTEPQEEVVETPSQDLPINEPENQDETTQPAETEPEIEEAKKLTPDTEEKTTEAPISEETSSEKEDKPVAEKTDEPSEEAKTDEEPTEEETNKDETPSTPTKSDVPGARWYVVHTYSGHENKVATTLKQRVESEHLENKILDILVPMQDKIEIKGGKRVGIKEKIFPGYILVKMVLDDISWLAVRTTQGVTSFVGMGNKPTPISDAEVQTIVKFTQNTEPVYKQVFMVDDTVKITDGPFAEFIGKVDSVDEEKGKVRVLVSIFGRETPVELDFLQVQKI